MFPPGVSKEPVRFPPGVSHEPVMFPPVVEFELATTAFVDFATGLVSTSFVSSSATRRGGGGQPTVHTVRAMMAENRKAKLGNFMVLIWNWRSGVASVSVVPSAASKSHHCKLTVDL